MGRRSVYEQAIAVRATPHIHLLYSVSVAQWVPGRLPVFQYGGTPVLTQGGHGCGPPLPVIPQLMLVERKGLVHLVWQVSGIALMLVAGWIIQASLPLLGISQDISIGALRVSPFARVTVTILR